ncbi:hypothetical protein SAY87_003816 [Trapa incisa]|uniref:AAA+ ATPase domain-containing protein n=1 Tax=Trapa incisa TaxID=236973 RepID=A0AAN7KLB4_9MYRT|nr:hypothetical protein SAY87_003816 [Trapa incisa]
MLSLPENFAQPSRAVLSFAATLVLSTVALRLADRLPDAVETYLISRLRSITGRFSFQITVLIRDSNGLTPNQLFDAATVYLSTKLTQSVNRIDVHKPVQEDELVVTIDRGQELIDTFNGVKLKWVFVWGPAGSRPSPQKSDGKYSAARPEPRHFELRFPKRHRNLVLQFYLPWILRRAKEIGEERKAVKLHTVDYGGPNYWGSINLNHPATFETLAMDAGAKAELLEDLNAFVAGREYYKRAGRSWKRGYLLYGPPGTGKSSLVAAMANYLKFDVYDLDLNEVQCNSDLRRLLIGTGNKSIIVIEDINFSGDSKTSDGDKITLSGLLNFIDGLWSSCGDQRVIVFTTNHKDRLDPALLRPGRMDMHIHMSYCSFNGFKTLARNYLALAQDENPFFVEIERLLEVVQATPAEIAGELMKSRDPEIALRGLVKFLRGKLDESKL